MDPSVLILAASNIGAVVVASWLEQRIQKRAARKAEDGTKEVARLLALTKQTTDEKLDRNAHSTKLAIEKLDNNTKTTEETHKIVNNQRTVMLNLVAELRRKIAVQNPEDDAAQLAARLAEIDAFTGRENK